MRRARELAAAVPIADGPNPRVGCVIVAEDGTVIAEGAHQGAGTAHAEVVALREAGAAAQGATAIVTLEPCDHTGRTGPCTLALQEAGIARVVFGQHDPSEVAGGGEQRLRAAGIDVEGGVDAGAAQSLNEAWTFAITHGRPFVTWKVATSLDGRVAAADGTSRWITGPESRREVHRLRARCDAVVVGSGTVLADDPHLTVRDAPVPLTGQPLRVVMGESDIPAAARMFDDAGPSLHLRTRDPEQALSELATREVRHVLLECGPRLAAAFLRGGLIDEVEWYVAPVLLGAGASALSDFGITTMGEAPRLREVRVDRCGDDARIIGRIG